MATKCINKNTIFYKSLVKQGHDAKEIAQITDKLEQKAFKEWYGNGERDSFGNPALVKDLYIINDKGEKITTNDLLNGKEYTKRQFYSKDLTYLDKINKFLEEERVGISKRISAYRDTDYATRLEELLKDLDKIDKLDTATALDKHGEYILKTVEDLESRFYNYDKINVTKLSKDELAKHEKNFKNFLVHSSNFLETFAKIKDLEVPQIDGLKANELIKKLKEIENRVSDLQNRVKAEVQSKVRETLEGLINNPDVRAGVIDFLTAQVDETKVQLLLDALGDSHIPFIAAIDKFYKRAMYDRDEESKELTREWKDFVKKFDNFDTFLDRVLEKTDGKRTGKFIPKYSEAFYDTLYKYSNELGKLKEEGKENTQEYIDLLSNYFNWRRDNIEQKYVSSYYDSLNLLIPQAKEAREKIDEERSTIMKKGVDKLSVDDFERLRELELEMKWLKSTVNKNGEPKTGVDLEIANSLFQYSKEMAKFYYTKGIAKKAFEKAKVEAEEKGGEYYDKWLHFNTMEQYSEDFWKKFKEVVEKLTKTPELTEVDDKIKQLTIAYKNERGEVDVESLPEDIRKELLDLKAAKRVIKSNINKTVNISVRKKIAIEFKNLVQFVPTSYYLKALSEKQKALEDKEITQTEYDAWYDKNHEQNIYTEEMEPIDIWTTMRPRNSQHIERIANRLWQVTDIKPEFANPNFDTDANGYALPTAKWISNEYNALSDKDKEDLDYIQDKLLYLVEHSKNNIIKKGYLPAIPKDKRKFIDALKGKEVAKEDFSEKAITESGEIVKFIPFKYVKRLNQTDLPQHKDGESEEEAQKIEKERKRIGEENKVSHGDAIDYNIGENMPTFIRAALTNKYKTEMELDIKLFQEQLKHSKVKQTDAKGQKIYDKIRGKVKGEKVEHETSAIGSNMEKHFNEWLEGVFYEDFELDEGKLTDYSKKIQNFTSLRAMGFNVLSGLNNKLIGNIQGRIESSGGRFFNYEDYRWARRNYFANITNFIAERESDKSSNHLNAFIKEFDVMISQDELANKKEGALKTVLHKLKMVKDLAYFMQHLGEHQIQNATLLAMARSHRVIDGQAMSFNEFYEKKKFKVDFEKQTLDEAFKAMDNNYELKKTLIEEFEGYETVMDSYELKDGFLKLKDNSTLTKDAVFEFKQRVIGINQRLHGIYNSDDAAMLQRYALGRLAMQFRKWMRPGWNRRFGAKFGKKIYNERIRDYEEGMYVSFAKFIANPFVSNYKEYKKSQERNAVLAFKSILSSFRDLVFRSKVRWHSMDEVEKANVRKTATEMLFLFTVIALGFLAKKMKGDDDDEDLKSKMLTLTLYQADRLFGELTTFTPIGVVREGNRLFSSPSPVFNTFEDVAKLGGAMFLYPFRDEESRTFKSGIYHGKDKVSIYLGDMLPVYNQVQRMSNMSENNQRYSIFK